MPASRSDFFLGELMAELVPLPDWVMQRALPLIPPEVRMAMGDYGLVLAGGFMRAAAENRLPKDVDLFHWNGAVIEHAAKALAGLRGVGLRSYISRVRVSGPVQQPNYSVGGLPPLDMVVMAFPAVEGKELLQRVISSFDLSLSCAGLVADPTTGGLVGLCHPLFEPDVREKRVTVVLDLLGDAAHNPGRTFMRLLSHASKGYEVPEAQVLKVVQAVLAKSQCKPEGVRKMFEFASNLPRRAHAYPAH